MSGNMPMGVTENDRHFNSDPDGDEPQDDQDELAQCCVLECDQPQAPLDTYCPHHALVASDMERLYQGALKAGFFNEVNPNA